MATNVSTNNNNPAGSRNDKETILAQAGHTVALLKALSHDPSFDQNYNAIPASASGYVYLLDFVTRTWREYWPEILSPQQYWDLSLELEDFHGLERDWHAADTAKRLEEMKSKDPSYDKDAWPSMDEEKYSDCIIRNIMAANIPLTPVQQDMMGGRYQYTEELKTACRTIVNQ
ncbi:hypothetical protein LTS08_006402 [Lithohypha guttulata]|uniref:Uncharacterized protein n=1 Tax=Lithohypha guttulata TaxID=1690604 RepID=A0AAN7Y9W3_9EURO|nr:hypothetical protein LTR05_006480 [Lithohypha guttulata]KAK5098269.1 hypothetical protein LTS08_006402 [Lithohypha guttulata]